jgi:hypothetical protein
MKLRILIASAVVVVLASAATTFASVTAGRGGLVSASGSSDGCGSTGRR